jgi:hypothetical protein
MKAVDVLLEAPLYGVVAAEGSDGLTRWSKDGNVIAWCAYSRPGAWICTNEKGSMTYTHSKGAAYNWCLDQAANGAI